MGNSSTSVPVERDILEALLELEAAAVCMIYAKDNCPGNDLGATATALAHIDLRSAINRLAELRGHKLSGSLFLAKMLEAHNVRLP